MRLPSTIQEYQTRLQQQVQGHETAVQQLQQLLGHHAWDTSNGAATPVLEAADGEEAAAAGLLQAEEGHYFGNSYHQVFAGTDRPRWPGCPG